MKLGFAAMGKRFEGIDKRRGIDHRLGRIEAKLDSHAERIAELGVRRWSGCSKTTVVLPGR